MRSLYARNGLDTSAVSYVEIHGTGTVAGDAAELDSIADVFGPGRGTASPLLIGSLKPNIGHLEAASGIAGLIKCALMLNTGLVPANINVEKLKDGLNLCDGKIQASERALWLQFVYLPNDYNRFLDPFVRCQSLHAVQDSLHLSTALATVGQTHTVF